MSANKFKVGDKVRVHKGLIVNKYYDGGRCNSTMARMGGAVLTIDCAESDYYEVKEHIFCWSDEMLEPAEKTLDNLCVGDFIRHNDGHVRKVLVAINGCYLLSCGEKYAAAGSWYTAVELNELGYCYTEPDTPKDLEVVD